MSSVLTNLSIIYGYTKNMYETKSFISVPSSLIMLYYFRGEVESLLLLFFLFLKKV